MDEVRVTPRFNKLGSSNNNLVAVEDDILGKKIQTCKNISKFKRKSKSSTKSNTRKRSKSAKSQNKDLKSFIKAFNMKKKFLIRNDFDKKNSKQFLKEKKLMLEKPILFDEI